MGPIALFDKSFLQSLNLDEATLFDHFFLPVISPLFFVETLADLTLQPTKSGRDGEAIVSSLAAKSPEMHGSPCAFHGHLGVASLLGHDPPFTGQIPRTGGRRVNVDGKFGAVFEVPEEAEAFYRWQEGEFQEVERAYASGWRDALSKVDLNAVAASAKKLSVDPKAAKNLAQVRELANAVLQRLSPAEQLEFALRVFSVPQGTNRPILQRWSEMEYPPLRHFARYANFVAEVEMFFAIALASGKISTERASNRCDISYLFYLPFCHVFVSYDRLHRECAPLFVREDQQFVWGPDLKGMLAEENVALLSLPEDERNRGLINLAPTPTTGLVRELWGKFVPRALAPQKEMDLSDAGSEALGRMIEEFANAPAVEEESTDVSEGELESITQRRSISHKRGSWYQLPKDMPITK